MASFGDLMERYNQFVADRDWDQFHTPKNLAEAISVEANELLEIFLWHDNHPSEEVRSDPEVRARVKEEVADVVIYSIAMAEQFDIDLPEAVAEKMEDNEERFDEETVAEITEDLSDWQRD
ncbi:nucleotide pyrophosphohydrolase [Halorubrum sp. ASP1]|uniref:nucleotide pyrophosphohydrolase n=1 Tax=Halorubrum sp. ASP1 TaxID=2518114 RepID=UPI0010F6CA24|nr:nucleotide pyrophosphohydrolase [Halorubrum sp. ASP1]TKX61128.1 nucleotide pyrophosphohydrolase [Halorubrum sp. ASP1]